MPGASVIVRAPWQGQDTASAPPVVPAVRGALLKNFLPGRPGKLALRGPAYRANTITPHGTNPGFWTWSDPNSSNDFLLYMQANGQLNDVNTLGMTVGTQWVGVATLTKLTCKHTQLNAFTYGIGFNNTPTYKLFKWSGITGSGTDPIGLTNAPHDFMSDVATWLSRVFVLGGTDASGGGARTAGILYWSDPDWDGTDTAAKWQDDVSGLINKIVLDPASHTLRVFNGAMYILGDNGVSVLRGTSPANFSVRQINAVGCLYSQTDNTAVVTEEGIYYTTPTGLVLFDGVQVVEVDQDIRGLLGTTRTSGGTWGTVATVNVLDKTRLSVATPARDRWLIYDRLQRQWSEFNSGLFSSGIPTWLGNTPSISWAADAGRIIDAKSLGQPDIPPAVLTSLSINNGVDTILGGGTTANITAQAKSKLIELGTPRSKAALHRVCADLVLQSPAVSSQPSWTLTITDEAGTALGSTSGISTTTPQRQRPVFDVFGEVDSVQLVWDVATNGQKITAAEIHDASIEFLPGRDRTG